MDWRKKELEVLQRAADIFDLPADVIADLPHIELIGDRQLLLSSHRGILTYCGETIDINGGSLIVRVKGRELELMAMTDSELRIRGSISGVELLR